MDVAALIISILSAVLAGLAVVHAKRSADAAERSAHADEGFLAIERERADAERQERRDRQMPNLDAGAGRGSFWALNEQQQFTGLISNRGPSTAVIERIEIETPQGRQDGTWEAFRATLAPDEYLPVAFYWRGEPHDVAPNIYVRFRAMGGDTAAQARFTLRRAGGEDDLPLWRQADLRVRPA